MTSSPSSARLGSPWVALGFLTRVPVGSRGHGDLGASAWAFPLVGALVGLVVGIVATGGALVLPVLVAAVLAVLAETLLTGALHLDGLADCADGCGGRDREARLRIMKDSSVGVYGVAAVVLDLLLKVALVHALLLALPGWAAVLLLTLGYAVSRAAILPLAVRLPSARPAGTGGYLLQGLTSRGALLAGAVVAGLALVVLVLGWLLIGVQLGPRDAPWLLGVNTYVAAVVLALTGGVAGAAAVAAWARHTLRGVTGDVMGACAEVALLTALVAVSLVL